MYPRDRGAVADTRGRIERFYDLFVESTALLAEYRDKGGDTRISKLEENVWKIKDWVVELLEHYLGGGHKRIPDGLINPKWIIEGRIELSYAAKDAVEVLDYNEVTRAAALSTPEMAIGVWKLEPKKFALIYEKIEERKRFGGVYDDSNILPRVVRARMFMNAVELLTCEEYEDGFREWEKESGARTQEGGDRGEEGNGAIPMTEFGHGLRGRRRKM